MYIVSKDGSQAINMDNVTCIYASKDGHAVMANFVGGGGCKMARYSRPVAGCAVRMLAEAMDVFEAYRLPSDEDVDARMDAAGKDKFQHFGGRKPKGHGCT